MSARSVPWLVSAINLVVVEGLEPTLGTNQVRLVYKTSDAILHYRTINSLPISYLIQNRDQYCLGKTLSYHSIGLHLEDGASIRTPTQNLKFVALCDMYFHHRCINFIQRKCCFLRYPSHHYLARQLHATLASLEKTLDKLKKSAQSDRLNYITTWVIRY